MGFKFLKKHPVVSVLIVLIVLVIGGFTGLGISLSEPGYQGPKSDHFNGKVFQNPNGKEAKGLSDLFKFLFNRDRGEWKKGYEETGYTGTPPDPEPGKFQILFINHSTFLVQMDGINILTDPIWSRRCSPFSFMGPERHRPPGIAFTDLPRIDVVLLSHNHYDHLDISTILKLKQAHDPLFIVPLGVDLMLRKRGISSISTLDWHEDATFKSISFSATPAIHFSSRGMLDRDKTLWCGYLIDNGTKRLYFAGDTGYDPQVFKSIRERYGKIDLAMIPIGAYKPAWFMSPIHVSPQEAVKIHLDVKSTQSVAMHFGTFALADEGQGEAERDLMESIKQEGIDLKDFLVPEEGFLYTF